MALVCPSCKKNNIDDKYFCKYCGTFLKKNDPEFQTVFEESEQKIKRIVGNLDKIPHRKITWSNKVDNYAKKMDKVSKLLEVIHLNSDEMLLKKQVNNFVESCYSSEFQIAFVGTIKTGKSTLINALLGSNYASMAVTPETAALTKFRSSEQDYVKVKFYSAEEWKKLWQSRSSGADIFMQEYTSLKADAQKDKWVGHALIYKELTNEQIKEELSKWSSSKSAEHYFVKEIEVGISTLGKDFPKQVVFVDTPGLSDPVAYRSEITKGYIRRANAVFVCVDAKKIMKEEIETISSVFSFVSNQKEKVYIIATQWDLFSKPVEDWNEQKAFLEKQLSGKGFFGNRITASNNIYYSSAYINNLSRDYQTLDEEEKFTLLTFFMRLKKVLVMDVSQEDLGYLIQISNIPTIRKLISDKLVSRYAEFLTQDISKDYRALQSDVVRYAKEECNSYNNLIVATGQDIGAVEEQEKKAKSDFDELTKYKQQLEASLRVVDLQTQQRLDNIVIKLDEVIAQCGKPTGRSKKSK